MKLVFRGTFVVWLAVFGLAAPAQDIVSQVKDIRPGSGSSLPNNVTVFNGALYFRATNGSTGQELWKTDGTPGGTVLVKDINPAGSSLPSDLTVFNGALYFVASDGSTGEELWKSDGTEAGTVRVADINPGGNAFPNNLTVFNGALYFQASDGTTGVELWKTNGTNTVRVADINPGSGNAIPDYLTAFNGVLYFSADDGSAGVELWKTDGTNTALVKDISPGGGNASPFNLMVFNGALYLAASDGSTGVELWKTDGTSGGTVQVKDIYPGSDGSAPGNLTVFNGALYFQANDSTTGFELWKTNGTAAGTVLVKDINLAGSSFPSELTVFNGALYLQASDGSTGVELWKTDGTASGTVRVADINPGGNSFPFRLTIFNGALYFVATNGSTGVELWKTDGTSGGTVQVKDIRPGSNSSLPNNVTVFNGALYFAASDGSTGEELWKLISCDAGVVSAPTTPAKLCPGQTLPVTFQTEGTCPSPPANAFTVQLSDGAGSFANPTNLGYAQPGTTNLALPSNLPTGSAYQVRIVTPTQTSPPSAPFAVEGPTLSGAMPAVSGTPVCRGSQVTLTFSLPTGGCAFPTGSSFTAQLSNFTGSFGKPLSLGPVVPGQANSLTIPASLIAGSGYRIRVVSGSPAATSSASLPFQIKVCNSRMSAEEAQLVIAPNPVVGSEIRCRATGMDNPSFSLTTASGRSLSVTTKTDGTGEFVLTPKQRLAVGVYILQASEGSQRLAQRVVVAQ